MSTKKRIYQPRLQCAFKRRRAFEYAAWAVVFKAMPKRIAQLECTLVKAVLGNIF